MSHLIWKESVLVYRAESYKHTSSLSMGRSVVCVCVCRGVGGKEIGV